MPDELWMEVCDVIEGAVIKTIAKKKKFKKEKWLSKEALQTAGENKENLKAKEKKKECRVLKNSKER